MTNRKLISHELEYLPCPDGDNRLDVDIREGECRVTYFSTANTMGQAHNITIVFADCYAARYIVTEDHESHCPGFATIESDLAEVDGSLWIQSGPKYVRTLRHFVFALNHYYFECVARDFHVLAEPANA